MPEARGKTSLNGYQGDGEMLNTIEAVVHDGKIQLIEPVALHEGDRVLVTLLGQQETAFWKSASEGALKKIWANDEDDVYASLLKE
jgi:hypothetical protein